MSEPDTTGEKPDTRFKAGQPSANPKGRPKGSRNALGEDFLKALHEDFQTHGVAAIQSMRAEKPAEYVKVIASILPKELNVKIDAYEEMTDDELIQRIRDLGAAVDTALGRTGALENGTETQGGYAQITSLPPVH